MARNIAERRPVPAGRANENLSNLVEEGGKKQHYDQASTRIQDNGKNDRDDVTQPSTEPSNA